MSRQPISLRSICSSVLELYESRGEITYNEKWQQELDRLRNDCAVALSTKYSPTALGSARPDRTIRQLEFELEKAEHGMALPYDAEHVGQLRKMLVEARKRKLSARWQRNENCPEVEFSACRV